jgi:uncharacterized protein YqeY
MAESLRQRLEADMRSAMKSGDVLGRDTIRFLLSALKNAEIEKRGELDEDESNALLQRQAKRMNESIEQFRAGGRIDLADRETAQLSILLRYLPAELSDDELADLARQVVAETGATSAKDMRLVMPVMIERVANRASGKRISSAVLAALAESRW